MPTLLLRHVVDSAPPRFVVQRPGGKETPPALDTVSVLAALLDGPQAEQFGKPAAKATGSKAIPVTVAVLVALQTHVHIERDAAGKWNLLLDKPTTSEALLAPIVQRLLALPAGK